MRITKPELEKLLREIVREERSRLLQETIRGRSRKNGREILRENEAGPSGGLFAKQMSYGGYGGMYVEDPSGEHISLGEMVLHLVDAGDTAFFNTTDGEDAKNLESLLTRHADGVQGGVQKWDSDVFETHYNVNPVKLVNRYAYDKNVHPIHWLGEDDEMPSDIAWREQNTPPEPEYEDDGTNEFEERYS